MSNIFIILASSTGNLASTLGGITGLIIACGLCVLVGKVLHEQHDIELAKIKEDREAKKNGKKVKRTVREKIRRFFVYYFPMLVLLLMLIGLMSLLLR
ncbi:hypothetical protein IKF74_01180 [Candidatus Saccharibacteria bacterium]|nr:hypothetical protein [Candidatus Saccharibacteria bacterium]